MKEEQLCAAVLDILLGGPDVPKVYLQILVFKINCSIREIK